MALIGLISDVHATPEPVADALSIFAKAGVDQILCAGDITGYMEALEPTIALLVESNCQAVIGNHDLLYINHHEDEDTASIDYLRKLPVSYETVVEDNNLYMVHAQPPDGCHGGIKLLDKNGNIQAEKVEQWSKKLHAFDYDVLIIGHTHQVFAEFMGGTLVINPGSSAFNNSCAILRLPELTVEVFSLCGKPLEKTWNWGEHVIYRK